MVVNNVRIYDLEESMVAAGYPMRTSAIMGELTEADIKRCNKLSAASNSGNGAHEQFMTGIRVNFDLTFTNKAWVEAERYRFLEFVSSQSTMHRITKFELDNQYNEYVDKDIIEIMKKKIKRYEHLQNINASKEILDEAYLEILYSNPAGFKITARMTTNYRCLKNIYIQRKSHRLPEWKEFCAWIETLPYFEELINTNK